MSARNPSRFRIRPDDRLVLPPPAGREVGRPAAWLAAITLLGVALRIPGLGSDLWLDEILTVVRLVPGSVVSLFTGPETLNNHLLHTLLVRVSVAAFGVEEWAVRLPALLFGVATIPALYLLARLALRSREALFASVILATSYHHVFFSQNARGYTGLLLWTALSTWFLLRALIDDRWRDWILYFVTGALAPLTILLGGAVALGQMMALPFVALRIRRAGGSPRPAILKAVPFVGAVGMVGLAVLEVVGGEAFGVVSPGRTWTGGGFWEELGIGLRSGLGIAGLLVLVVVAAPLAVGALRFARRRLVYAVYLVAPLAPLGLLAAIGFFMTPRYLLWALPVFAIGLPAAVTGLGRASRWMGPVLTAAIVAASASALPHQYTVPKQASRTSLDWVRERADPGDRVVAIAFARWSTRFYAPRTGLDDRNRVMEATSVDELKRAERGAGERAIWLLTTYPPSLVARPRLLERIERCYRPVKQFPATIHRMEITVWRGSGECGPPPVEH